jgi:4-amino-4-deoxy-L-arabinose transferase-like glycosyltransferase
LASKTVIPWLKRNYLLLIILSLALGVRLWGLDFGLPYTYHVDEPRYLNAAVGMWQNGNLDPGWFMQPSLYTYLVALVVGGYYYYGRLTGQFSSPADLFQTPYNFDGLTQQPAQFLLARLLTVLLALLTIWVVYAMARRWMNKAGALAAAAFLTFSIFHVTSSHFVATDAPVALFIMLALYFCGRLVDTGNTRDYLLIGFFTGLAMGTKYSAYVLVAPALLAHLIAWRQEKTRLFSTGLLLMGGTAAVTFLVTTPYALVNTEKFVADIQYEWTHHKVRGHVGSEGESGEWLLRQLLTRSDRWLTLLAAVGFLAALWRRNWPVILTFVFVLTYFVSMASNLVRFERFLVPMIPAMCIGAGYSFAVLNDWLAGRLSPQARKVVLLLLGLLLLMNSFVSVITFDRLLAENDVRTTARNWVKNNLRSDVVIAREYFSPNLDALSYNTIWIDSLNQHPAEWYREEGFDYLLFSEARYGIVWRDPDRYADLIEDYESLWEQFELVAAFEGPYVGRPNHHILIYRVP